jgi:hypothetical protein
VKINDRAYRVSEPLLDLCVSDDPDECAAVADFLDGKPAGPLVRRAFECCGALKALDTTINVVKAADGVRTATVEPRLYHLESNDVFKIAHIAELILHQLLHPSF